MKSAITEKAELMVTRFAYEDSLLAGGYSDGQVRIFNLNTDNKISQIDTNPSKKEITPVNALRWRPTNEDLSSINSVLLVANTNGRIFQYIAKTGKELWHTA
jgi:WD40 repeat protein